MLVGHYSSCEYEYGDGTWADLMTSYWGEDIAYDELGNPLNWINGETLTWQNGRQLASVGGVSYGYNADGLRVSKTWALGSTEYYAVDGQYIGEKTVKNGTQYYIYYIYDENGSPAGITVNGTQYWFVKNLQGDVTAILDSSGTVVANYCYDAYGYIISITNGSGANVGLTDTGHIARLNPFRYRGYMYDEETEFYYLRSRYYDPYIGRFLNADNQLSTDDLSGINLFAYCGNNPVNRIDPTGEAWWHWAIGAAIVVACAVATVVTCGGFAAAAGAVAAVGSGVAAATTASTVAAGAFIGSATVYGMAVVTAASTSSSVKEFNDKGNWGTVASTAGGAVVGGASVYVSTRTPTTKVYRSVSNAEAQDIKSTGQFNLSPVGMESKQFGFNLAETRQFGNMVGQDIIVSAKVPTSMLNQFYTGGVDTSIFRSGTLTVYGDQLWMFNQAVSGTIKIMQ